MHILNFVIDMQLVLVMQMCISVSVILATQSMEHIVKVNNKGLVSAQMTM